MIHLLPETVSSQLRSGVAITSVAQGVEELVLNSLDAGATCIAVRLDLSCFKIQVVDNGSGIPINQMDLLASRHHTSKCKELHDLDNLEYFGFRGEALASIVEIAAVVDIVSRVKHCSKTYIKLFTRGKQNSATESKTCRPAAGTTVTVHDLFNKLPVRKKTTNPGLELEKVRQRLEGIALMHPSVSLSLRNDENSNKILQSGKCNSTIGVFRHLFSSVRATANLKEVCCNIGSFKVQGFISSEGHLNKNLQFVYINSRLVLKTKIHKLLMKLLGKFYSSRRKVSELTLASKSSPYLVSSPTKQSDKHAVFLVNVTCAYNEYDITFDPSKTLVEFKDWESVLSAVEEVVKDFQKQLSPEISSESVDVEESAATTSKHEDLIVDPEELNLAVNSEISTTSTARSLHSKLVKRPSFGLSENTDVINVQSEEMEDSANPVIDVSNCNEEKTVCGERKLPETDPKSSDIVSANPYDTSSNEDSGVELELAPNPTISTPQITNYKDLDLSSVKTEGFNDLFQEPMMSRLSLLKQKVELILPEKTTSLTVKDKIEQLKQLVNISSDVTKQSQGQGMPRSSVLTYLQRLKEKLKENKKDKSKASAELTRTIVDVRMDTAVSPGLLNKKRPSQLKQTKSAKLARLAAISSGKDVNVKSARNESVCCKNEELKQIIKRATDVKSQNMYFHHNAPAETFPSTSMQGNGTNCHNTQKLTNLVSKLPADLERSKLSLTEGDMPFPRVDSVLGKVHCFIEPFSNTYNPGQSKPCVNTVDMTENHDIKSHKYLTTETLLKHFSASNKKTSVNDGTTVGSRGTDKHSEQMHKPSSPGTADSTQFSIQRADQKEKILKHQNFFQLESLMNNTIRSPPTTMSSDIGVELCAIKSKDTNLMSSCFNTNMATKKRQSMELYSPEGQIRLSPDSQTTLNPSELFKGYNSTTSEPQSPESLEEYSARKTTSEAASTIHDPLYISPSQGFDFKSLHVIQNTLSPIGNQDGYISIGFELHSSIVEPMNMVVKDDKSGIEKTASEILSIKDYNPSEIKPMEIENNSTCILKSTSNEIGQIYEIDVEKDVHVHRSLSEGVHIVELPAAKESVVNTESDAETMCSDKDLVDLLITPSSESGMQRSERSTPPQPNQPAFFDSSLSDQLSTSNPIYPHVQEMDYSNQLEHKSFLSLPLTGLTNEVKPQGPNSDSNGSEEDTVVSVLRSSENDTLKSLRISSPMEVTHDNLLSSSMQTTVPKHVARTTAYRKDSLCHTVLCKHVDFCFTNRTNPSKESLSKSPPPNSEKNSCDVKISDQVSNDEAVHDGGQCRNDLKQMEQNSDKINCQPYSTKDKLPKVEAQLSASFCPEVRTVNLVTAVTKLNSENYKNLDAAEAFTKFDAYIDMTSDIDSIHSRLLGSTMSNSEKKVEYVDYVVDQVHKSIEDENTEQLQSPATLLVSQTEPSQSEVDPVMIKRSDPKSGRKIFIHPLTGHTLSKASWELWRKQNPVPQTNEDGCCMYQSKELLPHELANQLSKTTPNICQSEAVESTSAEGGDGGGLSSMWSDHVSGQSEVDNVKWRHPMTGKEADPSASAVIGELFQKWHNPVFNVPEQDVRTAELPARQTAAVKVQKAIHPCRFTKAMLTQTQVLGQVDDKFIACLMRTNEKNLSAEGNLLVLVDQHAAHERVRLEQLTEDAFVCDESGEVKVLKRSEVKPPMKLILTEDNIRVMTTYRDKFLIMGIEFATTDGRDTILLDTVPACFMQREANEIKRGRNSIIMEMVEIFIKEQVELLKSTHGVLPQVPPAVHKLLCSQACHGAIKFGDGLDLEECCDVVESLSLCNLPFQCAHGRPSVMPLLNLDDFKNKFPNRVLKKPRLWKLRQCIEEKEPS